ncbi:exo-alpha-sialidase [Trypanosoma cruzi]|nr:exo-alpha-sialidase [Trypanosoma cruzi]
MNEGPLPRVADGVGVLSVRVVCWLRGCGRIPLAVELNWRRWRWLPSPRSRWVTGGGARVCFVDSVLRRVHCASRGAPHPSSCAPTHSAATTCVSACQHWCKIGCLLVVLLCSNQGQEWS